VVRVIAAGHDPVDLRRRAVRGIPVVEDDKPVGMASIGELGNAP
jgi:hypothetical protein